jgi:hypothetical protein
MGDECPSDLNDWALDVIELADANHHPLAEGDVKFEVPRR